MPPPFYGGDSSAVLSQYLYYTIRRSVFQFPGQKNGGTDGAELDVFESPNYRYKLSDNVNVVTTNIHIDGYGREEQSLCVATPFLENDPYENFNTYGVEWNENE